MQELVERARLFALEKYSTYTGKFGPQFMQVATEESITLALKYSKGMNLHMPALLTGIYLHDIGRTVTHDEKHAIEGKKIAEAFLAKNCVLNKRFIGIVLDCVLNHGSDARPTTKEGELVQFIDKAVLINSRIVRVYFEFLCKDNDITMAQTVVIAKLNKWYNTLGCRKVEFENEYKFCMNYIRVCKQSCN